MVVNIIHEDCWRSLKYARFIFSTSLKAGFVGVLMPAKLTSPAASKVTKTQDGVARYAETTLQFSLQRCQRRSIVCFRMSVARLQDASGLPQP